MFLVSSLSLAIVVLNLCPMICLATFKELVAGGGWKLPPPNIDLGYLLDEDKLPRDDTGKWIFEEIEYRGWCESKESKLLWLYGGPGTGKTMLAKRVAAQLLGAPDPPSQVNLVFHFISPELSTNWNSADEAKSRLTLAKVACNLLYSILEQDRELFDGCKAELEKEGDRLFTNPGCSWNILRKVIQDCQTDPIYVLIDGVDALVSKSHKELMRKILGLMEIRTVKIFLSSRDVPHIANNLCCDFDKYEINLDMTNFVRMDVETFIKRRVNEWRWDVAWREKAVETLIDKSEGIFLWASLAIDNLARLSSGPDFGELLKKPQSGLKEVYQKMLHSLNPELVSEEVLNMIRSVALALRPLTFSELGHILACMERKAREEQRHIGRRPSSKILPRTEEEIRMCVKSSMGFLRATKTTVCIVHRTAIEYLFCANCGHGLPGPSIFETELTISWECFRYLHDVFGDPEEIPSRHHNAFPSSSLRGDHKKKEPEETSREVPQKTPREVAVDQTFLRYAAESWLIHARHSIEISMHNFCNDSTRNWLQYQFFKTSDIIRKPWIEHFPHQGMEVLSGEQTPLHIAACLGLLPLVRKALSDFTKGTNSNRSLLSLAANPKALVKQLARRRAYRKEINKKNSSGNTPLHIAIEFDHTEIVECLVNKGADRAIKNNDHMTALELAEKLGRGDSLKILKRPPGQTPLLTDTEGGYNTWYFFKMSPDWLTEYQFANKTKYKNRLPQNS